MGTGEARGGWRSGCGGAEGVVVIGEAGRDETKGDDEQGDDEPSSPLPLGRTGGRAGRGSGELAGEGDQTEMERSGAGAGEANEVGRGGGLALGLVAFFKATTKGGGLLGFGLGGPRFGWLGF